MSETNKELAKRFFEEVWNKSRRNAIAELLAPNAVLYESSETIHGPEGFYSFFDRMQATFSDIHISFNDAIAEGHKVCLRWSAEMRHTGDGFGVLPSGKVLHTTGITVVRIANGQFLEGWQSWDMLGLMQQIQGTASAPTYIAAKTAKSTKVS